MAGKKSPRTARSDSISPAATSENQGSSPSLEVLRSLAQSFCFCRNRRLRFGGDDEEVLRNGVAGMCGRLVSEMMTFLKRRGVKVPSQKYLADNVIHVHEGAFGSFLAGTPRGDEDWTSHARKVVKFLLRGDALSIGRDEQSVADRLDEYFFRGHDSEANQPPAFFQPERQRVGEPCSRQELAGEIRWLGYERQYTSQEVKLIWVSGETAYFPEGSSGRVAQAVEDLINVGGAVTFVTRSSTTATQDANDFTTRHDIATGRTLHLVNLNDPKYASVERRGDFLNPALQFLYFYRQAKSEESLFILRGDDLDDDLKKQPGPIAIEANRVELAAFKKWLNALSV
jgi:hypothetical protein